MKRSTGQCHAGDVEGDRDYDNADDDNGDDYRQS